MNAVNMAHFIAPKSDQLNADDLIGGPRTITITGVSASPDAAEQPVSIHFEGDDRKPFKPCKSMRRVMVTVWGADANQYVGRSMTLYRDPKVQFGGMQVGGIRISHMSHIDEKQTMALTATRAKRAPFTVLPLKVEQQADKAADWAASHIAAVKEANEGTLQALIDGGGKAVAKLQRSRLELYAEIIAAYDAKRSEFATVEDEGDPFEDDSPAPWAGFVTGITKRIETAEDAASLDEIAADLSSHSDALPEGEVAKLDKALAAKRKAI